MNDLTRRQRDALAHLKARGQLWPATVTRMGTGPQHVFARRTLQALVDAGLARWVTTPGVMPYITHLED